MTCLRGDCYVFKSMGMWYGGTFLERPEIVVYTELAAYWAGFQCSYEKKGALRACEYIAGRNEGVPGRAWQGAGVHNM